MRYSDISVEDRAGVRVASLNRPESMNSLRFRTIEEREDLLSTFSHSSRQRALIITGNGDVAFCAGGDIKEMQKMGAKEARSFAVLAHKVVKRIETTGKPILSAVNGLALGAGCDLALTCDLCLASENAKFGMPSLNVGVISPFGGMSRLMESVGISRAKVLVYTGSLIGAQEALSVGIVHGVLRATDLMQGSIELARRVLEKAPTAFALSKLLFEQNARPSRADALEIAYYARCFKTKDQKEGATAFSMKRKPVFTGE